MTKRDFYVAVVEGTVTDEMKAMAQKYIEQLDNRKANRKPSKVQKENEVLKEQVLEVLGGREPMTVTEIMGLVNGDYSNQKMSAIVRALVNEEKLVRTVEKRKAYFAVA